jgi:hypothetical protein
MTSGSYFTKLHIMFFSMVFAIFLFGYWAYTFFDTGEFSIQDDGFINVLYVLAPGSIVAGFILGRILFGTRMRSARKIKSMKERLQHYSGATTLRLALLEIPAIICLFCFYMSGDRTFFYMGLFSLLLMLVHVPTRHKLITELQLNHVEKRIFENTKSKITY